LGASKPPSLRLSLAAHPAVVRQIPVVEQPFAPLDGGEFRLRPQGDDRFRFSLDHVEQMHRVSQRVGDVNARSVSPRQQRRRPMPGGHTILNRLVGLGDRHPSDSRDGNHKSPSRREGDLPRIGSRAAHVSHHHRMAPFQQVSPRIEHGVERQNAQNVRDQDAPMHVGIVRARQVVQDLV
jgi:hypothetical protein